MSGGGLEAVKELGVFQEALAGGEEISV